MHIAYFTSCTQNYRKLLSFHQKLQGKLWQDMLYRFGRCSWKMPCHRWNRPLFWSFCPTDTHWMVFVSTRLWPRPWRNCAERTHFVIIITQDINDHATNTLPLNSAASHLQRVDARPDVVVRLLTQRQQSCCVRLHPLLS